MNKIYKVVWSKAKHAYVVTSEVARSHTKSASGKAVKAALAAAVGMGVLMGGYTANAADTTTGSGSGVAYGTGSNAPKAENVAIGKGASIVYSNGASAATGDVAVGNGANINNYASQGGSIAIGKNAHIENMAGGGEASFAFGQTTFSGGWFSSSRIPADPTKVVGSVAIGDNTFARTGSTMIGSHNYKGALGDTTVDSASTRTDALNVYATTIGANSFSNGAFTTSTGVYNIISSDYNGGRLANPVKNLGATITGSLNSIESKTGSYYSGIANTVSGVANRTANSNGSLIYGAGNEITNSYTPLYDTPEDGGSSAKAFADKLRASVRASKSGGATLAIGGGNKADYTQKTSIIGVNNTVTGTSGSPSTYNSITGYNNTATNVKNVSVIGSDNNVTNTNGAVVFGDKRTLTGADGSVVIGSSQNGTSTSVKNAVAIGSEANVTKEGGVALGAGSVASVDKGVAGYDPGTGTNSTDTSSVWKSTQAAVSVGDTSKGITRQITGVAAGTNDTDAVNVAQLRKAKTSIVAAASTEVRAGTNITSVNKTADPGDGHAIYTINAKDTVVTGGTATYAANGTGTATLTNSDGTTATVTGLQDSYTSSASLSGDTLNFTRNDGSTYSVSGIASSQDIKNVTNKVGELGTRVNRVGAGAAALAALHPLDFDPDDKWDFAAGYGNYKDAHAVSVGAFYRPNEDTMFSVGGSFGAGENMVNAGVSVKLGQGNHVSTSKVAMAKEIVDLRDENKDLKKRLDTMEQKMNSILGILDMGKKKDFPDVPENHWAYEYVATLAGNGIIEGYPDGEFKGDRSMTRYEFAAMFYRALKNGAPVDDNMDRAMNEFEPELRQIRLDRIRVDRISGKDNDRNKVERVRVNSEDNKAKNDYRDVYGSHISPKA